MSQNQKGKTHLEFYWSKRQWVAVVSAGSYASLHLTPVPSVLILYTSTKLNSVAPPGEYTGNIHPVITMCIPPIMWKHDVKENSTCCVVVRGLSNHPQPQATCKKHSVEHGHVFEICEQTGRKTHKHTDRNTLHPSQGQRNNSNMHIFFILA